MCDITGETWWIKDIADKYHYRAAEAGVKIVNCCGYDSIPFDLGTLFVVDHLATQYKKYVGVAMMVVVVSMHGFLWILSVDWWWLHKT